MAVASPASPIRSVLPSPPPPPQTLQSSSPPSDTSSISSSAAAPDPSNGLPHSLSLPREADLQSASRTEEYRQLFRLPAEVVLLQDFNCALQESILLQGHMYLFDRYICFYSNIFGFETKKIIPFNEVTLIRRAKTAGLFPNAIEIVASGKKHFFASFLSRDEAFKIIEEGWSKHSNGARVINDQDSISETGSQTNGTVSIENSKSSELRLSASDCEERELGVPTLEDRETLQNNNGDSMGLSTSGAQGAADRDGQLDIIAESSKPRSSNNWEEETLNGPEVPEHYTKVAESKFPIKVEDFFNLFFSDDAFGFMESFRKRCGDKDFKCTKWHPHETLGRAREVSFQHPIKVYFGAKCGGCKEIQSYRVYGNSHLVVKVSQEVSDVPYADYFQVEGLWDVQPDDNNEGCILCVYVNVAFSKKTVWRSKIEQSTMEECREAYATWIELAHEVLKQKNLEKSEGTTRASNVQSLVRSSEITAEPSRTQHEENGGGSTRATEASANLQGSQRQIQMTFPDNLFDMTAIASLLGSISAKVCSFLKSQGDRQRVLIILFAIIVVLMQFSIVMLLSRPQQIYVVPQTNPVNTVGLLDNPRGAETMAWLEKRIHMLKDEMVVVEAQIERMRHEHILLKAQMKVLELLHDKQR